MPGLCWAFSCAAQTVVLYPRAEQPVAELLRDVASVYGDAFTDQQLVPGDEWRAVVATKIRAARVVFVVWSCASIRSNELAAEWRMALASGARIVPVLTDAAPLPAELARLQWLDWRKALPSAASACAHIVQ